MISLFNFVNFEPSKMTSSLINYLIFLLFLIFFITHVLSCKFKITSKFYSIVIFSLMLMPITILFSQTCLHYRFIILLDGFERNIF